MFRQAAETVVTIATIQTSLNRKNIIEPDIKRYERDIQTKNDELIRQEQYVIDLRRVLLVRKIDSCQSNELISSYQQELNDTYKAYHNIEFSFEEFSTVESLESQLKLAITSLTELRERHHALQQRKLAAEEERENLEHNLLLSNPVKLLNNLANAMLAAITKFENDYPANQSNPLRHAMQFLDYKIKTLARGPLNNTRTPDEVRMDYYRLFGLLAKIEEQISLEILYSDPELISSAINIDFKKVLESLMTCTSICSNKEMFIDRYDCKSAYVEFIQEPIYLFRELSMKQFYVDEANNYATAKREFNNMLQIVKNKVPDNIYSQVLNVLVEVDDALESLSDKKKQLLYKFLTNILNTTNNVVTANLIKNNSDVVKRQELIKFENLIKHQQIGCPDLGKKIKGAALMLLGTLLVGLSIVAKFTTLGFSTPVTAGGVLAGSVLLLHGRGLFKDGMQKGLYKALHDVDTALGEEVESVDDEYQPGTVRANLWASYQP
jgi:hypothetical protein